MRNDNRGKESRFIFVDSTFCLLSRRLLWRKFETMFLRMGRGLQREGNIIGDLCCLKLMVFKHALFRGKRLRTCEKF